MCIIPCTTRYQLKAEIGYTSVRKLTRSLKPVCEALNMNAQADAKCCMSAAQNHTNFAAVSANSPTFEDLTRIRAYLCLPLLFLPSEAQSMVSLKRGTNTFCKYQQNCCGSTQDILKPEICMCLYPMVKEGINICYKYLKIIEQEEKSQSR